MPVLLLYAITIYILISIVIGMIIAFPFASSIVICLFIIISLIHDIKII